MLTEGLNVTINTDDPSISQITLSDEYRLVCEKLGLSHDQLHQRVIAAAQATFLPQKEREELVSKVEQESDYLGEMIE
jgi:adenosine deaminase